MSLEEEFAAMRVVPTRRSGDTRIQRQVGMSLLGFYYVRWSRVEVVAKIRGIHVGGWVDGLTVLRARLKGQNLLSLLYC